MKTLSTIENYLGEPLHPLVALEYVLTKQQCSLLSLDHRDSPTMELLYSVAKYAPDDGIRLHKATVDALVDVCSETRNQFKRIIEAVDEGGPASKRIREYASAGYSYIKTCLHKYKWHVSTSTSTYMSETPPPELL